MAFLENRESSPYVEGLVFEVPKGDTGDPDEPAM